MMTILKWLNFGALCLALVVAPWAFGAWEMWWFWPFMAAVSAGAVFTGLQLVMRPAPDTPLVSRSLRIVLLALLPFLAYATYQWVTAEVFMSAERSVLLHIGGVMVAIEVIFGLDAKQKRLLFVLIFLNLMLEGAYGIINELFWKTKHVMWSVPYPQYHGRAMGSYYCPDHFSGLLEILLSMALALLLARRVPGRLRLMAIGGAVIALVGILMSLSRGGLLTLPIIFGTALIWGVAQWPREVRLNLRMIAVAALLLAVMSATPLSKKAIHRLANYGGKWGHHWRNAPTATNQPQPKNSFIAGVTEGLKRTCRGRMYGGAWRAWQSAPWLGIGAGMHQNLWPHFAATTDGDRELGTWPILINDDMHSYEVHSDWLQLLEEYGIVGFVLFLIAFATVAGQLLTEVRHERDLWADNYRTDTDYHRFVYILSALLALAALAFHSFGDFNLQIPATVWILSAILALGLSAECEM